MIVSWYALLAIISAVAVPPHSPATTAIESPAPV
jgi:hypothetical protein